MHAGNHHEFTNRFSSLLKSYQAGLLSSISVPLYSQDQVIGSLHIRSLAPDAYIDADVALAEKVGNQIAGAIPNAQLFQELERALEALREREERFRTLLQTMEEATMRLTLKETIPLSMNLFVKSVNIPKMN